MLSRASSDAGRRLRRAKSNASVTQRSPTRKPDHIDENVAHRHALAAATIAFERAHGSEVCGAQICHDRKRSKHRSRASEGSHLASRQSSFRSAFDARGGRYHGRESSDGSFLSPRSETSENTVTQPLLPGRKQQLRTAFVVNENTSPGAGFEARLRRAQSSLSPEGATKKPALPLNSPRRPNTSPAASYHVGSVTSQGTSGRTLSFSKPLTAVIATASSGKSDDEIVAMARDRYLQDIHRQRLRQRPSFIREPLKRLQDRVQKSQPAKSSTHGSDNGSPLMAVEISSVKRPDKNEKKQRSTSGSLKDKIKRVFRKTSNSSTGLPPQQLDASRAYFGSDRSRPSDIHSSFENIPAPDETTLMRASSRSASSLRSLSVRKVSSAAGLRSRSTSFSKSEGDDGNVKSRVTSWSDSSAGDTFTSMISKRLSTIQEHGGPHEPNSAKGRVMGHILRKRGPFENPLRKASGEFGNNTQPDPKRLFSALKKEIDRSGADPQSSPRSQPSPDDAGREILPSQRRFASLTSTTSQLTRRTIRAVTPDRRQNEAATPSPLKLSPIPTYDLGPGSRSASSEDRSVTPNTSNAGFKGHDQLPLPRTRLRKRQSAALPSAEQIANRIERADGRWKSPLEEDRSPFFPHSPQGRVRRKNPYEWDDKSSLPEIKEPDPVLAPNRAVDQPGAVSEVLQTPMIPPRALLMSPSIYSRATDQSPAKSASSVSIDELVSERKGIAITKIHPLAARNSLDSSHDVNVEPASDPGIPDWRSYLASELVDWTVIPQVEIENDPQPTTRKSGHHRERAQINDEDDQVADRTPRLSHLGTPNSARSSTHLPAVDEYRALLNLTTGIRPCESSTGPQITERSSSKLNVNERHRKSAYRPRSAADLRGQNTRPPQQRPFHMRRRAIVPGDLPHEDLLKKTGQGLYIPSPARTSTSSPAPNGGKENSYVAADTFKATTPPGDDGGEATQRPGSSVSNRTPTSGQRMADAFLSSRRTRGGTARCQSESPVFL